MTVIHTHHLLIDGPLCPFGDVSKHECLIHDMALYLIEKDGYYTDDDAMRSLLWCKLFRPFDVLVLAPRARQAAREELVRREFSAPVVFEPEVGQS